MGTHHKVRAALSFDKPRIQWICTLKILTFSIKNVYLFKVHTLSQLLFSVISFTSKGKNSNLLLLEGRNIRRCGIVLHGDARREGEHCGYGRIRFAETADIRHRKDKLVVDVQFESFAVPQHTEFNVFPVLIAAEVDGLFRI